MNDATATGYFVLLILVQWRFGMHTRLLEYLSAVGIITFC